MSSPFDNGDVGATMPIPGAPQNSSSSDGTTTAEDAMKIAQSVGAIPGGGSGGNQVIINGRPVMLPRPVLPSPIQLDPNAGKISNPRTAAGVKTNNIMGAINAGMQLIAGFKNKQNEKIARDVEYDLNIIQAAGSNPSDPHNQALLEELKNDPKRMKRLEKAMGINPFEGPKGAAQKAVVTYKQKQEAAAKQGNGQPQVQSGGANNSMEIPGMAGVSSNSAMGGLLGRMPMQPQVNPTVQIQAQLVKAGLIPKASDYLKFVQEIMTNDSAMKRAIIAAQSQNNGQLLGYLGTLQKIISQAQIAHENNQSREKIAGSQNASRERVASTAADARKYSADKGVDRARVSAGTKGGSPEDRQRKEQIGSLHKSISETAKEIDQALARKNSYLTGTKISDADRKAAGNMDKEIERLNKKRDEFYKKVGELEYQGLSSNDNTPPPDNNDELDPDDLLNNPSN